MENSSRQRGIPLIDGRRMRCPRCKQQHDILAYVPMIRVTEFEDETHPIYKCPTCRWIFAPAAHAMDDLQSFGSHP